MFLEKAFAFSVEEPEREIHLLSGHSFDRPLASKRRGTLRLKDGDDGLRFEADLPEEAAQPSWMRDTVLSLQGGLIGGLSPGFSVPPPGTVPNAEELTPEPGNPGVQIRVIRQAVLYELSLVTPTCLPGDRCRFARSKHRPRHSVEAAAVAVAPGGGFVGPRQSGGSASALTAEDLRARLRIPSDVPIAQVEALLEAASALVERYASVAPTSIKNEATVRAAGWMRQGAVRRRYAHGCRCR